jgi:hypothetical protein
MADKKGGGSMPKQTGTGQKTPGNIPPASKPVTPNKGFEKKPK